jgi:hypothetical protein
MWAVMTVVVVLEFTAGNSHWSTKVDTKLLVKFNLFFPCICSILAPSNKLLLINRSNHMQRAE